MKFLVLIDNEKFSLEDLPENIEPELAYTTAGKPKHVLVVEINNEAQEMELIKLTEKFNAKLLPAVEYRKYSEYRSRDLQPEDLVG